MYVYLQFPAGSVICSISLTSPLQYLSDYFVHVVTYGVLRIKRITNEKRATVGRVWDVAWDACGTLRPTFLRDPRRGLFFYFSL